MQEWKGTSAEKALVSIHPERFEDANQVALSTLFVIGNEVYGSRRNLGSLTLGVQIDKQSGDLVYTTDEKGQHAKAMLTAIVRQLGGIPEGFADMPEPKQVQRTKANKYTCPTCKTNIRYAAAVPLQALCMHAGRPEFGQSPAQFAIQVRTPRPTKAAASAGANVAAPAAPQSTSRSNIENVMDAVKHGAAKVVHNGGRMFGQEQPSV